MLRLAVRAAVNAAGFDITRRRKLRPVVKLEATAPAASAAAHTSRFTKYHVGCGPILLEGFLNVDSDFSFIRAAVKENVAYRVEDQTSTFFLQYDLRRGIPAQENTLEMIYHCHFLEHLSEEENAPFLLDCYRCLKPGGLMRIAVPDLEFWCGNYMAKNSEFYDWYRKLFLGDDKVRYPTHGAILGGMLYNWGHKITFDFAFLSARLAHLGFVNITRESWGKSRAVPEIPAIEKLGDVRSVESLLVECRKPLAS